MSAQSEQYAVALFELANEKDQLKDIQSVFSAFLNGSDDDTRRFFLQPNIHKDKKKTAIKTLEFPQLFNDFMHVIIDNHRFDSLKAIFTDFNDLIDRMHDVMHIHVYSKTTLNQTQLDNIKQSYQKKYQRKVMIEPHIDERIIGGLRFEYEGKVLDQTINQTLSALKHRLTK